METRLSQRPPRAQGRRSRAPSPRRSSRPPYKPADVRLFGRALDLLVRSTRMRSPNLDQVAQRAYASWRSLDLAPLEFDAVEARVRGVVIATPEQELRWVLPAFMAGLRTVRPRPELREEELRSLAEALAHLDPNVACIEAFRDWIWSGAAAGFELELQSSFMEALDDAAMEREVEVTEALDEIRAAALRAASEQAELLSSRSLARVADREELDLPMCTPETCANETPLPLAAELAERLQRACEGAGAWVAAEVRLVTTQRALADTVRVDRFAKRLRDALQRAPDETFVAVEALAQRARLGDPFALELLQALDETSFGEHLGVALWRDPQRGRGAVNVLLALGAAATRGALGGLLARASSEAEWVDVMRAVLLAAGGRLDAALLDRSEVPSAGGVSALLAVFGERGAASLWRRALGDPQGWLGRSFATLCRAMLDGPSASSLVLAARDRSLDAALRVEVLEVLAADPARLAEAIAWRMGELLEPPLIRERLKLLRART